MIIFDSRDLEQHGITHQSASQLVFKGRTFTKKETFAARLRHLAVELAE
ncbi:MAG: hypothetical protein F6K09_31085, partial [Merismopedia sp. SIO2A8]|nr:hypothetical protein [Merismopedia sp. SIO2A8]